MFSNCDLNWNKSNDQSICHLVRRKHKTEAACLKTYTSTLVREFSYKIVYRSEVVHVLLKL
jgi:hypothetical protein